MIPILYEKDETAFVTNGLCRLRDAISVTVTEERNNIFECDFEYPVDGANYDFIQCGRIIGVTHDETGDIQPFDIVSYSKPINGVVTFHAVHISYRMTKLTVSGTNINSLADALTLLGTAEPTNPFSYSTNMTSSNYMASADGVPRSVRQMIGGVQGSILDSYGGELVWDKWNVEILDARGKKRDFAIRYGVNLLDYTEDTDYSNTYNSCIPFWKGQDGNGVDVIVKGNKVTSGVPTYGSREMCVPLDLTDKFETTPTTAQLEAFASSYMQSNNTTLPSQSINVDFVRLAEMGEFSQFQDLLKCSLCDTVNVIFPMYNVQASFKIVKTVWNVLRGTYESMELGTLSQTLSEALGITQDTSGTSTTVDYLIEQGTSGIWTYRKWNSGVAECWGTYSNTISASTVSNGNYINYPFTFTAVPNIALGLYAGGADLYDAHIEQSGTTATQVRLTMINRYTSSVGMKVSMIVIGKWK